MNFKEKLNGVEEVIIDQRPNKVTTLVFKNGEMFITKNEETGTYRAVFVGGGNALTLKELTEEELIRFAQKAIDGCFSNWLREVIAYAYGKTMKELFTFVSQANQFTLIERGENVLALFKLRNKLLDSKEFALANTEEERAKAILYTFELLNK